MNIIIISQVKKIINSCEGNTCFHASVAIFFVWGGKWVDIYIPPYLTPQRLSGALIYQPHISTDPRVSRGIQYTKPHPVLARPQAQITTSRERQNTRRKSLKSFLYFKIIYSFIFPIYLHGVPVGVHRRPTTWVMAVSHPRTFSGQSQTLWSGLKTKLTGHGI